MSPRTLRIALYISVALNLIVVTAVVTALSFGPDRAPRDVGAFRGGPPEIVALSRALDRERRVELRNRLRNDGRLRQGLARIGQGRDAVLTSLRADPFVPDDLRAALSAQQTAQRDLAARGLTRLVEVIEELTPEERAAFATELERSMMRRRR